MSRNSRRPGPAAIELLESGVHLLRAAPARVLAIYYLGSLPFVLAFLFFWSDMSRSAFARDRLEPLATLLTLLFVWMKTCQLAFVRRLREQVQGIEQPAIPLRRWPGLAAALIFWSAIGFLAFLVASILVWWTARITYFALVISVPVSLIVVWWAHFSHQSLLAAAGADARLDHEVLMKTWRLSRLWWGQNLAVFLALLVAGLVVTVNIAAILALIPQLLKLLLGVESQFTRSYWTMFNTTFLTTVLAIAWLCLDPLAKAVYLLRFFHAESVRTGDDIRAELRVLTRRQSPVTAGVRVVLIAGFLSLSTARMEAVVNVADQVLSMNRTPWKGAGRVAPREMRTKNAAHFTAPVNERTGSWSQCMRKIESGLSLNRSAASELRSPQGTRRRKALAWQTSGERAERLGGFRQFKAPGLEIDIRRIPTMTGMPPLQPVGHLLPFRGGEGRGEGVFQPALGLPVTGPGDPESPATFDGSQSPGAVEAIPTGRPASVGSPGQDSSGRAASASPAQLDKAIDEVLQRREYTWRMPREQLKEGRSEKSGFRGSLQRLFEWLTGVTRKFGQFLLEIIRWIADKIFGRERAPGISGKGWMDATRGFFILLLIALAGAIGYLIHRLWLTYRQNVPEVVAEPAPAVPDLDDDSLTAAQLPEDEWLRLAREMIAKGEFRLALRALYLCGLAHLAGRGLVTVARYKSNRDYAIELGRRAHALPEVMTAFRNNVVVFDRVWYGRHEATREVLSEFEDNLRRISAA